MATVEFKVDDATLRNLQRVLNPKQLQQALTQAVKRTTNKARTIAAEAVMSRLTIPRKYIDNKNNRHAAIRTRFTTSNNIPIGRLIVADKRLPLTAFKAIDTKTQGVSIQIDKNTPTLQLKNAFIARLRSKAQIDQGSAGHVGVMLRSKRAARGDRLTEKGYTGRLHIDERFGPSILSFITRDEIRMSVESKIGNEFQKNIDSQISRFTQGRFSTLADAAASLDLSDTATDSNTSPTNG